MIQVEKNSTTWRAIAEWATERLEEHRRALEEPTCSADKAAVLRGRIDELKQLAEATKSPRFIESKPVDYG